MLTLYVQCVNSSGSPQAPDACPFVDVYGPSGKARAGLSLPVADPVQAPGLFYCDLFLDSALPPGNYSALYHWKISGTVGYDLDCFEVIAGGDAVGPVLGLRYYERPQATFVVQQTWSGAFKKGKNPTL